MCGASTSNDLIWMKLSKDLLPLARQSEVLSDCVHSLEIESATGRVGGMDNPAVLEMKKGVLVVKNIFLNGHASTVRYDRAHPEWELQRR